MKLVGFLLGGAYALSVFTLILWGVWAGVPPPAILLRVAATVSLVFIAWLLLDLVLLISGRGPEERQSRAASAGRET